MYYSNTPALKTDLLGDFLPVQKDLQQPTFTVKTTENKIKK